MPSTWLELILINRGSRARFVAAHAGIMVLVTLVGLLGFVGKNVLGYLKRNLYGGLPAQEMVVETKKIDVSIFRVQAPGAKSEIDAESQGHLAEIPGVEALWPIYYARTPVDVEGSFLGQTFGGSVIVQGFDPQWLTSEYPGDALKWQPDQPIPVVLSSQLLAMYNTGYAKSQGLPELSAAAVKNRKFDLLAGSGAKQTSFKCQIVGFSNKVGIAICIPIDAFRAIHEQVTGKMPNPVQVVLNIRDLAQVDSVRQNVEALDLSIQEANPLVQKLVQLEASLQWISLGFLAVIGFLVAIYINLSSNHLFQLKRRDYALCRAMGMSRSRLRALVLFELILLVLLDLLIGFGLAWSVGLALMDHFSPILTQWVGFDFSVQFYPLLWAQLTFLFLALALCLAMPKVWWMTKAPAGDMLVHSR
ncbi:MAG: FtsX-like permease family protein [Acidobacteria bacterium]|nr:FtsX-like permease family protein [Acidobacteriota bacterium]